MIKQKLLSPFQKFVNLQSSSGIILLATTIIALVWANSAFSESYQSFWNYELGFTSDSFELKKPLILWVNDGLMAIFFFLIGLEIKREFLIGELNSTKKIMFPLFGAIGGIALPVLIYIILNQNPETLQGWGIPMATDIAFSLAILKVLGNRVPLSLKIFLTAFAIVDDLGAVLVIAIFYSSSLNLLLGKLKKSNILKKPLLSPKQLLLIDELEVWADKYQSPLQNLEHKLHNWVAYLIIPVFALANAGVALSSDGGLENMLIINIVICLVLGKSIGISATIFLAKKLKIITVPRDITNKQIIGVSFLAGIGFTMAIFIASLAFKNNPEYIDSAKIGILIGSFISAIIGFSILRFNTIKGKFDHNKL